MRSYDETRQRARARMAIRAGTSAVLADQGGGFAVVGVGAPAGLQAFSALLDALPSACAMSLVLVQPVHPGEGSGEGSSLPDHLAGHTAMTIRRACEAMPIEPNHVYLVAADSRLCARDGAFRLASASARKTKSALDALLQSLARAYGPRAVAVLLPGAEAQAAAGLSEVRAHGGSVIVQEPREAAHSLMRIGALITAAGEAGRSETDGAGAASRVDELQVELASLRAEVRAVVRNMEHQRGAKAAAPNALGRDEGPVGVSGLITSNDESAGLDALGAAAAARPRHGGPNEAAIRSAELTSSGHAFLLARASHGLRQPLQAFALLNGLLERSVQDEKGRKLVGRLNGALYTLRERLELLSGGHPTDGQDLGANIRTFELNDLFASLKDEFSHHAQAKGLKISVVASRVSVRSDRRLVEQIARNLLSNALKYTHRGGVLLGCRRRSGQMSIEVWDTGVGMAESQLRAISAKDRLTDPAGRESPHRLGLTVVRRLGDLLGCQVRVRSRVGKGTVFSIDGLALATGLPAGPRPFGRRDAGYRQSKASRSGAVLVVEGDDNLRDLLQVLLEEEGHVVAAACDAAGALDLVARAKIAPDVVLADDDAAQEAEGPSILALLRRALGRDVPGVVLTSALASRPSREADHTCICLDKPVDCAQLLQAIQRALPARPRAPPPSRPPTMAPIQARALQPVIFVVDDDDEARESLRESLEADGRAVEGFATLDSFRANYRPGRPGCLLIDVHTPGVGGADMVQKLRAAGYQLPVVVITDRSDVSMAVKAIKAGASNVVEKSLRGRELLDAIDQAIAPSQAEAWAAPGPPGSAAHLARLTARQRQIMEMVLAGQPSKNIAADLGISQRTVENHRAAIMKRSGATSLPALTRMALEAAWGMRQD